MAGDFRASEEFTEARAFYAALMGLGGHVFSARSPCGHASTKDIYFIGQSFGADFESGLASRLYRKTQGEGPAVRLNDRETRQIGLSPDGRQLAVACAGSEAAADRIELWSGDEAIASASVRGRIEQIDWSPDGGRLLLVVAGTGADLAGIHGGYAQKQQTDAPAWLPEMSWGEGADLWRSIWLWDLKEGPVALTSAPLNVWEASWCGTDRIAAIASDDHSEGSWYASGLALIDARSGAATLVYRPADQMGVVRGSPDGSRVAFIEAFCSDRGLVAGKLSLLDLASGKVGTVATGGIFARAVQGDMGGADADDILSGIEALVGMGIADTRRVAVTGTSYGGFMSAWLPTRSDCFAAAIPISPVGDWYSQHRTTQIPEFDALMLESSPWEERGAYFARSPAFHRQRSKVPTLVMAGGIDKSTPPSQALECHFAALRSGSPSALATYPNAGHSVRGYPEYIDTAARIVWWLETYVSGPATAPAT